MISATSRSSRGRRTAVLASLLTILGACGGSASTTRLESLPAAPPGRTVHLATTDRIDKGLVDDLVAFYRARYGLLVDVLPTFDPTVTGTDTDRRQLVAERVIDALRLSYSELSRDENAVIIGLVSSDMYIASRPDWRWAFGLRDSGRFAVISTAHMHELFFDGDAFRSRVRKMLTRDIGVLYCGLPLNDDPSSVLYRSIDGVGDLDRAGEDF